VAIAIDGQGRVIVNNQDARTIEVFAPDGRPLATVTDKRMRPEGLALDGNGQMWVADVSGRVLTFSETGNLLATWDNTGSGTGELDTPMGIAVDGDGRVYVSDSGDRVQVFAPDGAFLGAWGSPGTEAGQFSGPVSLTLDGNGHIYVVEHSGSRVQKFRLLPPSGAG
jgi:DNA-binding beta-propeller fold protein YncE